MRLSSLPIALLLFAVTLGGAPRASALDVEPWERVLGSHVRNGGVDYGALKADAARMQDLRAFTGALATMPDSAGLADWLNAYNALVVAAIVDRYPIASVRDVPGFFDRLTYRVAGRARTLDAIENEIIRVRFPDARVHAALVCGAASCPDLPARAFRAASLDATLSRLMDAVVASERHVRLENGRLRVSEIFFWFEADFARDAGSVRAFLTRHDRRGRLAAVPTTATLERIPYRWALNDRRR